MKMWLRGRPLLFYGPTPGSEEAVALEASHAKEAPTQKLKLNWVYAFTYSTFSISIQLSIVVGDRLARAQ